MHILKENIKNVPGPKLQNYTKKFPQYEIYIEETFFIYYSADSSVSGAS